MTGLYLIARIAGREIAIDSSEVGSVVDLGEIVPVPGAPPALRGLTALRSRVVTVIDTPMLLGDAGGGPAGRAVVGSIDGHHYAWLADEIEDVVAASPGPLVTGLALSGGWRDAARGMIEHDGAPLLVVALSALLPAPQSRSAPLAA